MREEIFAQHIRFLERSVDLISSRIVQIEEIAKRETADTTDSEIKLVMYVFYVRSLKLYRDTLLYISQEISREDPAKHYFQLPHLRTLLDIYARLIHLQENISQENIRALTCIAYQLHTYKNLGGGEAYAGILKLNANLLRKENNPFPVDPELLSSKALRKQGLYFPEKRDLLTPENFQKYGPYSSEVFGVEKRYEIYSYFSEFMHGNPYYYTESPHNERFWLISMSISTTAFLIEMVDKYLLQRIQSRDFREWVSEIVKEKESFMNLWKASEIQRQSI